MRATRTPASQPLKHFAEQRIDGHLVINPNTAAPCAVLELSHDELKLFYACDATCAVEQFTAYGLGDVAGIYLLKGAESAYVGQSTHVKRRISEHKGTAKVEFGQVLVLLGEKLNEYGLAQLEAHIFCELRERGMVLAQRGLEGVLTKQARSLKEQSQRERVAACSREFMAFAQLLGLVPARAAAGTAGPAVPSGALPAMGPRSEADRVVVQVECKSYRQLLIAVAKSLLLNGMSLQQFQRHWNGTVGKALNVVDGKNDPQWLTPWNQAHWADSEGPTQLLPRGAGPSRWICTKASAEVIRKHFESFWSRLAAEPVDFKMNVKEWPKGDASMGRLEFSFDLKKLSS